MELLRWIYAIDRNAWNRVRSHLLLTMWYAQFRVWFFSTWSVHRMEGILTIVLTITAKLKILLIDGSYPTCVEVAVKDLRYTLSLSMCFLCPYVAIMSPWTAEISLTALIYVATRVLYISATYKPNICRWTSWNHCSVYTFICYSRDVVACRVCGRKRRVTNNPRYLSLTKDVVHSPTGDHWARHVLTMHR